MHSILQDKENTIEHRSFFADAIQLELDELSELLSHLEAGEIKAATDLIFAGRQVFCFGAGRSGLALQMAAMRLMHLGLTVFVAGETTTPAIATGDLLIVASASGTSSSVVHAAEVARSNGAAVLAITAQPDSKLATLATARITLKASTKNEYEQRASQQYAGSLFEQAVLLVMDAVFGGAWKAGGRPAEELMRRHANLE
ncbi:6-phospho-3-hexuloisomerase [Acidipila sp. EB88]|uniref:6-phospho-3-hexuloisomerase n=1 Tax=Acidipila sp. EB88 TaxID=2305226 RepID=UPI000F5EA50B|nr:6-phospho-3-hexuloisomerase [Acidipila sp. EB88]RRA48921.1 SIS domain-containing protein [Acidipila sp. EB88]